MITNGYQRLTIKFGHSLSSVDVCLVHIVSFVRHHMTINFFSNKYRYFLGVIDNELPKVPESFFDRDGSENIFLSA